MKKKINLGDAVSLGLSAAVFLFLVGLIIYFNLTNARDFPFLKVGEGEIETLGATLRPSQVLAEKSKYSGQRIIIGGRVAREPVVCERKECPSNDSCCGCPAESNLAIFDPGTVLSSGSRGQLKLLDAGGKPFCRRPSSSCRYECQDWQEGVTYEVTGIFFAEAPPPGWKMSLEYYFQVEDKKLIGTTSLSESATNLFNEIKQAVKKFRTSGSYVLP